VTSVYYESHLILMEKMFLHLVYSSSRFEIFPIRGSVPVFDLLSRSRFCSVSHLDSLLRFCLSWHCRPDCWLPQGLVFILCQDESLTVASVSSVLTPRSGVSRCLPFFCSIGSPTRQCFCSHRRFSSSDPSYRSQLFLSSFFPVAFGFRLWPSRESPQCAERRSPSSAREQEAPLVLVLYRLGFFVARPHFGIWLRSSYVPGLIFWPTPALAFLHPPESRAVVFFSLPPLTLLSPDTPSCRFDSLPLVRFELA
jgi:hypothetical protein